MNADEVGYCLSCVSSMSYKPSTRARSGPLRKYTQLTMGDDRIMGWRQDVGAQGQDYAMTGTMLWAGLMCGEPIVRISLAEDVHELIGRPPSLSDASRSPRCSLALWSPGLL